MLAGNGILGRAISGADCIEAISRRVLYQCIDGMNALRVFNAIEVNGGDGDKLLDSARYYLCQIAPGTKGREAHREAVGSRRVAKLGLRRRAEDCRYAWRWEARCLGSDGRGFGDAIDELWGAVWAGTCDDQRGLEGRRENGKDRVLMVGGKGGSVEATSKGEVAMRVARVKGGWTKMEMGGDRVCRDSRGNLVLSEETTEGRRFRAPVTWMAGC